MIKYVAIVCLLSSMAVAGQKLPSDTSELCSTIAQMKKDDQLYRKNVLGIGKSEKYSKKEIDSVWKLQIALDNKNTEALIVLTKKHGWLSEERLNCDFKPLVFLIFRHSQRTYFDQIKPLITEALQQKSLSKFHHDFIEDHLKGRPKRFN